MPGESAISAQLCAAIAHILKGMLPALPGAKSPKDVENSMNEDKLCFIGKVIQVEKTTSFRLSIGCVSAIVIALSLLSVGQRKSTTIFEHWSGNALY